EFTNGRGIDAGTGGSGTEENGFLSPTYGAFGEGAMRRPPNAPPSSPPTNDPTLPTCQSYSSANLPAVSDRAPARSKIAVFSACRSSLVFLIAPGSSSHAFFHGKFGT